MEIINRTRILKQVIQYKGFTYTQIKRNNKAAIYSQSYTQSSGEILAYEVFKIIVRKQIRFHVSEDYDNYEVFPNDEAFGKWAWTHKTLTKAEEAYENLSANH